jgi:hypothetical protein
VQPLPRLFAILLLALASRSCLFAQAQSLTVIRRIDAFNGIVEVDKTLREFREFRDRRNNFQMKVLFGEFRSFGTDETISK